MRGWASLSGAIGMVSLAFGVLSLILWMLQPSAPLTWIWNLALGALLLAAAALGSIDTLRERLSSGEARRAGKYGTSALLSAVLAIAILGLLSFLAQRYSYRFDWSETGVNTLSDQSLKVLGALERDVRVTAFFNASDVPQTRDLIDRYRYASDGFRVEYVDPNERPDLVATLGVDERDLVRGIMRVAIGDDFVDVRDMNEVAVTNALVKLTRDADKTVYFLDGHNERRTEGKMGAEPAGLSRAVEALRNETYTVKTLLLATLGEVPEDADALVIAGPTRMLHPQEHGALRRYVEQGGALLVMMDPRSRTDLYDELRDWGVGFGDDVIVDSQHALFGKATSPFAGQYSDHPITVDLREVVLFHQARSVELLGEAVSDYEIIVRTGDESWGERNLDGWIATGRAEYDADDVRGPVPIAVAGSPKLEGQDSPDAQPRQPRLVVFGDSDFATNEYIENYRNRDLFLNAVNWLVGDDDAIAIRPNLSRASRFDFSTEDYVAIQYFSLLVLPQAIALMGVLVWWGRRRGQGR